MKRRLEVKDDFARRRKVGATAIDTSPKRVYWEQAAVAFISDGEVFEIAVDRYVHAKHFIEIFNEWLRAKGYHRPPRDLFKDNDFYNEIFEPYKLDMVIMTLPWKSMLCETYFIWGIGLRHTKPDVNPAPGKHWTEISSKLTRKTE